MNKKKDLAKLFIEGLLNKNKCSNNNVSPIYNINTKSALRRIKICFYELSDLNRIPLTFYEIHLFEKFLSSCNITLQEYQRSIIENLGSVFISCYKGTTQLNIRPTYEKLSESMAEYAVTFNSMQINPNYHEFQSDGTFFG